MSNKKNLINYPISQTNLIGYENYFLLFKDLFNKNLLPNKILLSGISGIGKATFSYHLINYFLSKNEDYSYDYNKLLINPLNRSFNLINNSVHPNFYLIDLMENKSSIDIKQVREMIRYANNTSFDQNIKIVLIDNVEYLNLNSVNSLLKIIEEPNENTFFILIYDSSKYLINTLRSRCIEFKIHFSNKEKDKIAKKLLEINSININISKIQNYYNSPGFILNISKFLSDHKISLDMISFDELVFNLLFTKLKTINDSNFKIFNYLLETAFYNKFKNKKNKKHIYNIYSNINDKINLTKKYNLDLNNLIYEIKQSYLNA